MEKKKHSPSESQKKKRQLSSAYRYSGLAMQMVATVVAFVFIGKGLDKWLELDKSYFAFGLGVFATIGVHVYLIRSVIKSNKNED